MDQNVWIVHVNQDYAIIDSVTEEVPEAPLFVSLEFTADTESPTKLCRYAWSNMTPTT